MSFEFRILNFDEKGIFAAELLEIRNSKLEITSGGGV